MKHTAVFLVISTPLTLLTCWLTYMINLGEFTLTPEVEFNLIGVVLIQLIGLVSFAVYAGLVPSVLHLIRLKQVEIAELTEQGKIPIHEQRDIEDKYRRKIHSSISTISVMTAMTVAFIGIIVHMIYRNGVSFTPLESSLFNIGIILLILAVVFFIVTIDIYDTAQDPSWSYSEIQRYRKRGSRTYLSGYTYLLYGVLVILMIINRFIPIIASAFFLFAYFHNNFPLKRINWNLKNMLLRWTAAWLYSSALPLFYTIIVIGNRLTPFYYLWTLPIISVYALIVFFTLYYCDC